jgi:uncharacterized protein (DUF488 family)
VGVIYTIGHSTQSLEAFTELLLKYNINVVVDVRTTPFSKYVPQFNRTHIQSYLKQKNIQYLDFGKELGARRAEPEAYERNDKKGNMVWFSKVATLPLFINGINRLRTGIDKGYSIALMCTEKNPIDCHRFALVSRVLVNDFNIDVRHIFIDGTYFKHHEVESNMLNTCNTQRKSLGYDILTLEEMYLELNYKIGCVST